MSMSMGLEGDEVGTGYSTGEEGTRISLSWLHLRQGLHAVGVNFLRRIRGSAGAKSHIRSKGG